MKKMILILTLSTLALQGCIAGAIVGGTAAGATLANDKRSISTMTRDEQTTFDAQNHLLANEELKNQAHIVVATFNHQVLLAGQAPTVEMKEKAAQIVQSLPYVKRIYNQITIAQPTSAVRRSEDALITGNIKTRMIATTNIKASQFKVVTENGVVYLMGLAAPKQTDIAVEIIRNSTGVKKIVKLVQPIA